jgi:hypothetical protein
MGLWETFGTPLRLATFAGLVTLVAVAVAAVRGRRPRVSAGRAGLAGSILVVVLATALPRERPWVGPGERVLALGEGGLDGWRVILDAPGSLAAIVLIASVLLYIPFGFFGSLAHPEHPAWVISGAALLSILVEAWQLYVIGGLASTDDVLLNLVGTAIGWGLARLLLRGLDGDGTAIPGRRDRPASYAAPVGGDDRERVGSAGGSAAEGDVASTPRPRGASRRPPHLARRHPGRPGERLRGGRGGIRRQRGDRGDR